MNEKELYYTFQDPGRNRETPHPYCLMWTLKHTKLRERSLRVRERALCSDWTKRDDSFAFATALERKLAKLVPDSELQP